MLAIGERTLWELTRRGVIPCVRIGRAVRCSPLDLEAWIEARKSSVPPNATEPQI
jgi:excisionase family DNA binding protein